jgi:hypothetical protein
MSFVGVVFIDTQKGVNITLVIIEAKGVVDLDC